MGKASLGPIVLEGRLHETLWGGQRLSTVAGKTLPAGKRIGESWETALDATARNQPYAGKTLAALVEQYGPQLIGSQAEATFGRRFPLLAKFIDAQQQLSVQVHPDDAYAMEHEGGKLGKTEVWHILDATPDAHVVYGLKGATSPEAVRRAIAANQLESLLREIPVRAGDVIFVPAGTVHAICSGVVLYELQEYSDITYRLYDYGRLQADGTPRQLHVDQALQVMDFEPPAMSKAAPVAVTSAHGAPIRVLAACRYFVLAEALVHGTQRVDATPASCQIISVLGGGCTLRGGGQELDLQLGDTVVLPAMLGGVTVSGSDARLSLAYVPEADDAWLAAWRVAQTVALAI